jgi:hypothetical protein
LSPDLISRADAMRPPYLIQNAFHLSTHSHQGSRRRRPLPTLPRRNDAVLRHQDGSCGKCSTRRHRRKSIPGCPLGGSNTRDQAIRDLAARADWPHSLGSWPGLNRVNIPEAHCEAVPRVYCSNQQCQLDLLLISKLALEHLIILVRRVCLRHQCQRFGPS